jgi:ribonuclease E
LGIERMATDDMLDLDVEPMDDAETLSDLTVAREMALESSDVEPKGEAAPPEAEPEADAEDEPQDDERRGRRRRRRRGRRKGRGDDARVTSADHDENGDGEAEDLGGGDDDSSADVGTDDHEDGNSRNKSLHKDVTPWVEAVGIIVNANLETRARNPGGGNRGRWKGERR